MLKESSHRAEDLLALGWSKDDVAKYIDLWDYRQRWGAINLERDDRLFLRKAENALPKIISGKVSVRKPTQEKSYYRRLSFFLDAMNNAEKAAGVLKGARGAWPILLEEELRLLDYYEPVLGLPDTIKAKGLEPLRDDLLSRSSDLMNKGSDELDFDFQKPLEDLKKKELTNWRPLRETAEEPKNYYPVLTPNDVLTFRDSVRKEFISSIPKLFPSLAETEKPEPPDDWMLD